MDIVEEVVEKVTLRQLKARYGNGIVYCITNSREFSKETNTLFNTSYIHCIWKIFIFAPALSVVVVVYII